MKSENYSYGSLVSDDDLQVDFLDPNRWRWLVVILCMISFLISFKMTAYGQELGGHLSSYDNSVVDSTISHYMTFDYGSSTYDLSVIGLPSSYSDYIFYRHYLSSSDMGYISMIFLGPDSTVKMSSDDSKLILTNYYYIDQKIYSAGHTSDTFEDLKFYSEGYATFSSYGDTLEASTVSIPYEDGSGSFFIAPLPSILEGVTLTNPLTEILGLIPILMIVVVSYLGLRKALKILLKTLKTS